MVGNCAIRGVEIFVRIKISYRSTAHDEVPVFLDDKRIRVQSSAKRTCQVEVDAQGRGVLHVISVAQRDLLTVVPGNVNGYEWL